jgi:hypothetical protein
MIDLKDIFNFNEQNNLWFYNINQEQDWNEEVVFPTINDTDQLKLVIQQEQQQFFLASQEDTMLIRHKPNPEFLSYLEDYGVKLPNFLSLGKIEDVPWDKLELINTLIIPFMVTENIEKAALKQGAKIFGGEYNLVKELNNKFYTRELAINYNFQVTKGYFCTDIEQLEGSYKLLKELGFEKVVVKVPFGSSGKGLKIIETDKNFKLLSKFISRRSNKFRLLIEGWHYIQRSLNSQILIQDDNIYILAVTEQKIDNNGVYIGTDFVPSFEVDIMKSYHAELKRLGAILRKKGYRGIIGVDSIIDDKGTIYPIIEINARFTQVTYLLRLVDTLIKKSYNNIQSSFNRFESKKPINFKEVVTALTNLFEPDDKNKFLIYTYAEENLGDKTIYRIFILFYGKDQHKVNDMVNRYSQVGPTLTDYI